MATDRLRRKLRDTSPGTLDRLTAHNFCTIGTPLPDLLSSHGKKDANELKPIWQQEARDAQGRRRFHGAFTGGFSAGYFNTVGSKEGWTPSAFRSSRTDRRDGKTRDQPLAGRVEDFMDEEDLEDWKAAQQVSTSSSFGGGSGTGIAGSRTDTDPLATVLFGSAGVSSNESVGFQLLRRMGWKEGQGLGPRFDAKKKARLLSLISGSSSDSPLATSSQITLEDMKHLYAPPPTPLLDVTHAHGSRKGLGAHDPSTLHQTLAHDYKPATPSTAATGDTRDVWPDGRPLLPGFRLASQPLPPEPTFETEPVPPEWQPDPTRVLNKPATTTQAPSSTPAARGKLLGEARIPGPPPNIAAFLSAKARERLAATSSAALPSPPPVQPQLDVPRLDAATARLALQGSAPYTADPAKQDRYTAYLRTQLNADAAQPLQIPQDMNGEQYARELAEFAKTAAMFRPMSAAIASRFTSASAAVTEHETRATSATPGLRFPAPKPAGTSTSTSKGEDPEPASEAKELSVAQKAAQMGNFGHLTRTVEPWAPQRLLCKRFGIPEPAISRAQRGAAQASAADHDNAVRPDLTDDDPFYGSSQSSKSNSAVIRVDQHWERNKQQLKALAAAPTPLSLAAGTSSPAAAAGGDAVEDTAVGMGDDERQGRDTLTYVKPSIDVYKAIFESEDEASDAEDARAAAKKPKRQDPSSGSAVVFQARPKRKDVDGDTARTADKPASTKRKKDKTSKKALLTFDMDDGDDDSGGKVHDRKRERSLKKSLSMVDGAGDTAVQAPAAGEEPAKSKAKGRMRASDLF